MPKISRLRITRPGQLGAGYTGDDGIGMYQPLSYIIEDCIIDFSGLSLDEQDEAVGVTWGASATFRRCVIKGAGKLFLCGCGDDSHVPQETGRRVILEDCLLEDCGRRAPEVQDGMICEMERCVIRNWGDPSRFCVRNFGSWAHLSGALLAHYCVWQQTWKWDNLLRDIAAQVGQAWNDEGVRGLLRPTTWMPGIMHALRATAGGYVYAEQCRAPWWCILQGKDGKMDATDAKRLVAQIDAMAAELDETLPYGTDAA